MPPLRTDPRARRGPRAVALLRRGIATAILTASVAAALAGCGSSSGTGTGADPAGAVPATAPLYAGATVRPSGSQKAAALSAGQALTHQSDPYLRLLQLLQTPGSPALSFSRDVSPWLGPHAGIFVSSLGSASGTQSELLLSLLEQGVLGGSGGAGGFPFGTAGADGAIVLDTTNSAKASSFLASQARYAGAHAAAYRGVSYQATSSGVAFGLVDRFAVIGSESALRSVIDTTLGGASLASASGYSKLLSAAPSGAIAHLYVDAAAAIVKQSRTPGVAQLLVGARETNISLLPSSGSIALDADSLSPAGASVPGGLLAAGVGGAQALDELPGESWLAFGLGNVGGTLSEDVQGLRALASLAGSLGGSGAEAATSLNLKGLIEGLLTPLGVLGADSAQARHAFTSWMGSGGSSQAAPACSNSRARSSSRRRTRLCPAPPCPSSVRN